jgi:capsular exopolysaccharide synthesis family protein
MTFAAYVRALRKGWWLVLAMVVLGIAGGVLVNETTTPVYAAHVTFYVTSPARSSSNQYSDNQFVLEKADTYAQLMSSERLAHSVINTTGIKLSPGAVKSEIAASVQLNTTLVEAVVTDTVKARALTIANALAVQFPKMIDSIDNAGQPAPVVLITVTDGPTASPVPVSPRTHLNLGLGFGVGLILGLVLAAARELRDVTVRSSETLGEIADVPVIGAIPFDSTADHEPLIVGRAAHSTRAEALRQVRTNLQFIDVDNPRRAVVVTSSIAGEGKSMTATNLALAYSEIADRVLVVECDLRRPRMTEYLGLERTAGLSNVLAGRTDLDDVLQSFGRLTVLPSGPTPPNVSSMLSSDKMREVLGQLRADYDVVIIDAPPVLPVTDAAVLATMADGVIMVARHAKVTRHQLTNSIAAIEAVGAEVLGFVYNAIPRQQTNEYRGGYDNYSYRSRRSGATTTVTPSHAGHEDDEPTPDALVTALNQSAAQPGKRAATSSRGRRGESRARG